MLLIFAALAVLGALLISSSASYVTVVSMERHIAKSQSDLQSRDCYITAVTTEKKKVSGYGPSSFCSSVKKGDKVVIKEGFVTKK